MKHLFLTAAALATGAFALAQAPMPQQVVNKDRQSQESTNAEKGSNYSQIDQMGIGSDATVEQVGRENASYIKQTGTSNNNRNTAYLRQDGSREGKSTSMSYADLTQEGAGNDVEVLQWDDRNVAWANQDGTKNIIKINQGEDISYRGKDNYADLSQKGRKNEAYLIQDGRNNSALSTQVSNSNANKGNLSFQYQESVNSNEAREGNTAISTQNGTGNYAYQEQVSKVASIKGNYGEINQGDVTGAATATNATAAQYQSGTAQEAYIDQMASGNEAYQEQRGRRNVAAVEQNLFGASDLGGNFAGQFQQGDDHFMKAVQAGGDNVSLQEQRGSNNNSRTVQEFGTIKGNYVQTLQKGDYLNSFVRQRANGNQAFVDQLGDNHSSVIRQNATGTSLGNATLNGSNTATVIQRNGQGSLNQQSLTRTKTFYRDAVGSL